jgi:hypothetical protein
MNEKNISLKKKKSIYNKKTKKKIYLNKNFKLNNYNCFQKMLTKKELECFIDLLKIIEKIFDKHKIDWIPVSGSLLSLYRHQDLMIPWDDDCDITVSKDKKDLAIKLLTEEAPKYNCKLVFANNYSKGKDYKFFFNKNKYNKKYNNIINEHNNYYRKIKEKAESFNWPFVDIFIDVKDKTKDKNLGAFNLDKTEYPLKKINIRGINFKYPTNGVRSYDNFKKRGDIDNCISSSWNHKTEYPTLCVGKKEVKCDELFK